MNEREWWIRFARLARPAAPGAALVAGLFAVEFGALPVAMAAATSRWRWVVPLLVGLVSSLGRAPASKRLRMAVRPGIFLAATQGALERDHAGPEVRAEQAFWAASILELAIAVGLPNAVGAGFAAMVGAVLAVRSAGFVLVATVAAIGVVAGALREVLRRRSLGLFDAEQSGRRQVTAWFTAAAREAGEVRTREARGRLRAQLHRSAAGWAEAESRLDETTRRQWFILRGVAAALIGLALVYVAGLDPRVLIGLAVASADPRWRGLAILGATLPATLAWLHAIEKLGGARVLLHDLTLAPFGPQSDAPGVAFPTGDDAQIEARELVARYGTHTALEAVTFDVPLRGLVAVVGANGSGKSTLARLVVGVLRPAGGTLTLGGLAPDTLTPDAIAYLPQAPVLVESLSLADNVRLVAPEASTEAIVSALRAFELERPLDDRVEGLSRGEQQRIALARTLLTRARLLVLDEPDTGLDRRGRRLLAAALRRACQTRVVVMVTHRADLARHADRVIVLSARHTVEAVGAFDDVAARSVTLRELLAAHGTQDLD